MKTIPVKGGQGFASLTPEKRKEVARRGGLQAHRLGNAHQWTPEEARKAGAIGGKISSRKKKVNE